MPLAKLRLLTGAPPPTGTMKFTVTLKYFPVPSHIALTIVELAVRSVALFVASNSALVPGRVAVVKVTCHATSTGVELLSFLSCKILNRR